MNMEPNLEKVINMRIAKTIENLGKNGIKGVYVPTGKEALALLKTLLVPGETIGVGGSVTLNQIGALDLIRSPEYKFIDRYEQGLSEEAFYKRKQECVMADTFVSGTNAITQEGALYNIDGQGNRLCAFVFGPKRVIVLAGYNKIVPTLQDAMMRMKTVCAPANAIRLGLDTYCAKHGHCISQDLSGRNMMFPPAGSCTARLCNSAVITGRQPEGRMIVIIIGEELGY
jgi:hypothetical protein